MRASTVIAIVLGLCGCAERGEKLTQLPPVEASAKQKPRAVSVATTVVAESQLVRAVVATGTTEPVRAADLGPQMTARVNAVLVEEGEKVKAGAVLVRLDVADAQLRLRQTEASAASSLSQYQLAASEYERLAPLAPQGTVTAQQLQRLASQRDALKAASDAAGIAAENARQDLTEAAVRAPFAGVVSRVLVEVGEVATMMPPKVLVRLVDLSSVDVRVRVHERELMRLKVGDVVQASFPSSEQRAAGTITFISPEIDARTRTAEVVTRIPNDKGLLRAGMYAQIHVRPETTDVGLVIPATAVGGSGEERFVFVVKNGMLVRRNVRVSQVSEAQVEALEGLSVGDVIVHEAIARLSEGLEVEPSAASAPSTRGGGEK